MISRPLGQAIKSRSGKTADARVPACAGEPFRVWLTENFNSNLAWDKVVEAVLTADGSVKDAPAGAYFVDRLEVPETVDAVGRVFLGVSLECAECHHSPTTPWKQEDFWGLAAFFGRVKAEVPKKGKAPAVISESANGELVKDLKGAAIRIHDAAAKGTGTVIKARVLGGPELDLPTTPFRPTLAKWLVARDNPYLARATVNRWWAHFFARGLVHPIDDMHAGSAVSV